MSKPSSAGTASPSATATAFTTLKPEDYVHSPVHYAVTVGDHASLTRLVSTLPRLANPSRVRTESDSVNQERIADQIAAVLDRRDNPNRETPLHLAVRLNDAFSVRTLAGAGADISLQNETGWNALQEAVIRRNSEVIITLVQHQHFSAWSKWRRRLPRLVAGLRRMRDFYMEISFHFESSIVPFVGKMAPSDTYKIWKRDGNLRADTSLAGFDGLKIQRANQSFLFLGDGDENLNIPSGSLLVLNHDEKKIFDAFENAGTPLSDADIASFCCQTSVYRPGMDVTKADLVSRTNWRGQEKTESVGEWKAKVYEVHNVIFSFRSRKITAGDTSEQILPLELHSDDSDEGFLVAENPRFSVSDNNNRQHRHSVSGRHSVSERRHSSFVREESQRDFVSVSRKSVDIIPERRGRVPPRAAAIAVAPPPNTKEKEYTKSLKPCIWLTEQFPLKTEELLPLLDILANKVKAVRRMRELLTTKFPPGTFPVKVAIPVVPTVRVMITFTKFIELEPIEEQFHTPLTSPRQLHYYKLDNEDEDDDVDERSSNYFSFSSSTSAKQNQQGCNGMNTTTTSSSNSNVQQVDPFVIPNGYRWSSFDDNKNWKVKKSKGSKKK